MCKEQGEKMEKVVAAPSRLGQLSGEPAGEALTAAEETKKLCLVFSPPPNFPSPPSLYFSLLGQLAAALYTLENFGVC